ncbi:GNAT family N-acetyltransferase [Sphingobacterium cellulitidis]|uniref:GNAT family N-acetyltransferase n=1 Tax=Sphingobacterium cellulitidis TaxID=1768011 RepID=UPI000B93D734|nr:GNAT family N-acetyltransferase [Sphingobacterium cellulitidis]OYD46461.1 GNAT family N-acetyltransferase [Sphingobacterium cellulitidis]
MIIRRGLKEDSEQIAEYLLLAMEEIAYRFIGKQDKQLALEFLTDLVKEEGNQYSYNHNWVIEENGTVVATALVYDGANLYELRKPVADLVENKYQRSFTPEDETQAGEFYIDCIAVNPNQQGKGLGSIIIKYLIDEYILKKKAVLGLLVDEDNPKAKKLYERLGFKVVGMKSLMGKNLEHMQLK